MVDDPRDRKTYNIGITFLGLAAVVAIAGISWVCAEHWCVKNVPNELWFGGAAIFGAFVGALIAVPLPKRKKEEEDQTALLFVIVTIGGALIFGIVAAVLAESDSFPWVALLVTFGGLLLGLPIPSPGRRDG